MKECAEEFSAIAVVLIIAVILLVILLVVALVVAPVVGHGYSSLSCCRE